MYCRTGNFHGFRSRGRSAKIKFAKQVIHGTQLAHEGAPPTVTATNEWSIVRTKFSLRFSDPLTLRFLQKSSRYNISLEERRLIRIQLSRDSPQPRVHTVFTTVHFSSGFLPAGFYAASCAKEQYVAPFGSRFDGPSVW